MSKLINWAKQHKFLAYGAFVLVMLFIIIGANGSSQKPKSSVSTNSTPTVQPTTTKSPQQPSYVFDVPSLVGKNIDDVRLVLGKPADQSPEPNDQQKQLGADQWDNSFQKGNKTLLVTFNPMSRKVIDFFLDGTDKNKLIALGNLKDADPRYKIETVQSRKDSSTITGLKVTPN